VYVFMSVCDCVCMRLCVCQRVCLSVYVSVCEMCRCINMLVEGECACVWVAVCIYKDLLEAGDI
jgi:hypothetical protein